jgi:maleylacetate reductase
VIYDPELTMTLPVDIAITSGINAIAHAAEGLYARDGNPVTNLMAEEGIRALAAGLRSLRADPNAIEARSQALYGAWLAGTVLGSVGMAFHHKLCHTLGGTFGLPHAATHTVVLPHALAFNAEAAPEAMLRIARALGASDAAQGAFDLAYDNGAPTSLRALGMDEHDLDRAADIAGANPYWNPRPVDRRALEEVLRNAFDGVRPPASRR